MTAEIPLTPRVLIEAAVETPDDAAAAADGGADRLELCAGLDLGGLTPTVGAFLEVRAAGPLPVVVMIRPRGGDFVYSHAEGRVMARDVAALRAHDPAGFVFGALRPDGAVDEILCEHLVHAAAGVPCVFHRAFDRARDVTATLDTLVRLKFARVLTSGGQPAALTGAKDIANVVKAAAGRIEVLPCGKVRAKSVAEVVRVSGCTQVHGSFAEPVPVEPGRGHRGYEQRSRTSRTEVAATRAALDGMTPGRD